MKKRLKALLALTLIGLAFLLSAERNIGAASRNPRPNQHKKSAADHQQSAQQQQSQPQVPLAVFQASQAALAEALAAIKQQADAAKKYSDSQKESWYSPSVLVQVGLLIVGAIYSWFAYLQWRAIREQAVISRQELESTQRAFVFLKEIRLDRLVNPTRTKVLGYLFAPYWENSGTTPTNGLNWHVNVFWQPVPLPRGFWFLPLGDPTPISHVLGPKTEGGAAPLFVPVEALHAIQSRETYLYFYGTAFYRDVFIGTPEHRTRFCYAVSGISGDLDNVNAEVKFSLTVHFEHNDAT